MSSPGAPSLQVLQAAVPVSFKEVRERLGVTHAARQVWGVSYRTPTETEGKAEPTRAAASRAPDLKEQWGLVTGQGRARRMRRWPVTLYLCTTMLTVAQQGARVAKEGTSCFSGLCPCRIWPPVDCCALRALRNIKGSHPNSVYSGPGLPLHSAVFALGTVGMHDLTRTGDGGGGKEGSDS